MDNTTYVSLSRQNALWNQLEVVANNMANVNTIGFKGSDVLFSEYLVKVRNDERPFKDKIAFTQDFGLIRDMNQGPLRHTNNTLDLAIQGEGYFVLEGANGENYTRAGNLTLDVDGRIVNQEGLPLLSTNNTPITLDASIDEIVINGDGAIIVNAEEVDRIRVVNFEDPRELQQVDGTLFSSEGMPAIDVERPRIAQGALEDSNVNGVTEMTRLIALNRAYQDIGKMIESEHDRKKKANDVFTRQVRA
ncbi:MAG: flagellar basal-body rod protein FlgF [Alphaproteobacteria bacterium]|nr:flagellar basal-body rod protein FlgF [Alphaproteobacteria bacterium]